MRAVWSPWLLAIVTSLLVARTNAALPVEASDYFTTIDCSADATLCTLANHQICGVPDSGTPAVKQCLCDTGTNWKKVGDKCVKKEELEQKCGGDSGPYPDVQCAVPGSKCIQTSFDSPARYSCLCETPGFVAVPNPNTDGTGTPIIDQTYKKICGKVMRRGDVNNENDCNLCSADVSKCYALPTDNAGAFGTKRDGCSCDTSYSGSDCKTVHVAVNCDVVNQKMEICYTPHADVSSDTPVKMYITEKYNKPECMGTKVTTVADPAPADACPVGSYNLILNLPATSKADNCETAIVTGNPRRYYNTVRVEKGGGSTDSHVFTVFCEYITSLKKSSSGYEFNSRPTNNRGQSLLADVTMSLRDHLNKPIMPGDQIHASDKVLLAVTLTPDDTYGAVMPESCTLSPYADLSYPAGLQYLVPILHNGCPLTTLPADRQPKFKHIGGNKAEAVTGEFKVTQLQTGNKIYIHCKVKLCLKASEDQCAMPTCTARRRRSAMEEGALVSVVRLRRATAEEPFDEEVLTTELQIIEDEANNAAKQNDTITMTTIGFSVIIALLVALVMVAIAVVVMLLLKLRSNGNKVEDNVEMTQKQPQRFALPRINKNHMRI